MSRIRILAGVVAGWLVCGLLAMVSGRASADQALVVRPADQQTTDSGNQGATVQLVRHWHGGYGWGPGYGGYYGGWGGGWGGGYYRPIYRPYPVYSAPVIAPPVYGYPVYGYPAYGYGYGRCW